MERFDKKGMMIIPNPVRKGTREAHKVLVLETAYCPEGHDLISKRAIFSGRPGLLVELRQDDRRGMLALSPIFGDKARITLDIDLETGREVALHCPHCGVRLPKHSPCTCGADMIAFFLTPLADFADCIAICGRVDCEKAEIISGGELLARWLSADATGAG